MLLTDDHQSWGRWGGKLTSRDLPDDEAIAQLPLEERREIAEHWLARAGSERRVGQSFEVIRDTLKAVGGAPELIELATRAVDDELRHAEICRVVASRFQGEDFHRPAMLPFGPPEHRGASPRLKQHLWIVGQCALNETFASAVIEGSQAVARGTLATAALRELLSDEIDHARIGWAYLATLGGEDRVGVQARLLSLTRANLKMWRETPRAYARSPRALDHGALTRDLVETAILTAVRQLIIPGFMSFGFETTPIVQWLETGAPT